MLSLLVGMGKREPGTHSVCTFINISKKAKNPSSVFLQLTSHFTSSLVGSMYHNKESPSSETHSVNNMFIFE